MLLLICTAGFRNDSEFRLCDGDISESGEQQFDFVSGGESEEGAFLFKTNPGQNELTLRIGSYKLP